MAMIEWICVCG